MVHLAVVASGGREKIDVFAGQLGRLLVLIACAIKGGPAALKIVVNREELPDKDNSGASESGQEATRKCRSQDLS
jgi:hypothetical protein